MTTIDGYFTRQPIPENVIIMEDDEPTKIDNLVETHYNEGPSNNNADDAVVDHIQTHHQRRRGSLSAGSETSDIESLPPEYESRRPSGTFHHAEADREAFLASVRPSQPLLSQNCDCGNPQCITCSLSGRAAHHHNHEERGQRKCFGCSPKSRKTIRSICSGFFILMVFWLVLVSWKLQRIYDDPQHSDQPRGSCRDPPVRTEYSFSIPYQNASNSFLFQQIVENSGLDKSSVRHSLDVAGNVVIKNAAEVDDNDGDEIKVLVDLRLTSAELKKMVKVVATDDSVIIKSPRTVDEFINYQACMLVYVTVILPHAHFEPELKSFGVKTETLAVKLLPNISFKTEAAKIDTLTGRINSEMNPRGNGMNARRLSISSVSGAVSGVWGVGDQVIWDTKSGAIDIDIFPLPARPTTAAKEVDIRIQTISGRITVNPIFSNEAQYPFNKHVKEYRTHASSKSGAIQGQFTLGSSLNLSTISGKIVAEIIPVAPPGENKYVQRVSNFQTDSMSGAVAVHFMTVKEVKGSTHGISPYMWDHRQEQMAMAWIMDKKRKVSRFVLERCPKKKGNSVLDDTEPASKDSTALILTSSKRATSPIVNGLHKTISGKVLIHYPRFFEGTLNAQSLTGRVKLNGPDVEIVSDRTKFPGVGRVIEAVRGNETSGGNIYAESHSGSVDLLIV